MPAQKQSGSKSPKRSASRSRAASRGRPRKRSVSPVAKSADRPASKPRGRARARKDEAATSPRTGTRSPSVSRRRAGDDTPRGAANVRDSAAANSQASELRLRTTTEVRSVKTEVAVSSHTAQAHEGGCWSELFKTFHMDFFGPLGSGALMVAVPLGVVALNGVCLFQSPTASKGECSLENLNLESNKSRLLPLLNEAVRDFSALGFLLAWLALQSLLYLLPTGRVVDGYDVNERLRYRVNLPESIIIVTLLIIFAVGYLHLDIFGYVVAHLFGIMWWSTVFACVGALALYYAGRRARTNPLGNTGWPTHDYFMGRTRNPRFKVKLLSLYDIKMFFELRPGMQLWALIAVSYFAVHFREVRAIDKVTPWYGVPDGLNWNLALLVFFQVWYVFDSSFCEFKILSTFDIVTEGFGWMLLFGDMVFLPFLYSANVRYLLAYKSGLSATAQSLPYLAVLTTAHTVGYFAYRLSNNAKHAFRTNPNSPAVAHLRTFVVPGGRKILAGGWWSLSRHPNYIGDFFMSWSWALLCGCPSNFAGFAAIYFYPLFVTVLLVTRALRDDIVRREKYGEAAWKRYSEAVKWRIIPYVF